MLPYPHPRTESFGLRSFSDYSLRQFPHIRHWSGKSVGKCSRCSLYRAWPPAPLSDPSSATLGGYAYARFPFPVAPKASFGWHLSAKSDSPVQKPPTAVDRLREQRRSILRPSPPCPQSLYHDSLESSACSLSVPQLRTSISPSPNKKCHESPRAIDSGYPANPPPKMVWVARGRPNRQKIDHLCVSALINRSSKIDDLFLLLFPLPSHPFWPPITHSSYTITTTLV